MIHTYIQGETAHEAWTKVKHVPQSKIVAHIVGSWRGIVRWKYSPFYKGKSSGSQSSLRSSADTSSMRPFTSSSRIDLPASQDEYATLVDLSTLRIIPKGVRPLTSQSPKESRNLWQGVTQKLLKKEYSDATKEKVSIEQKQRDEAAERKRNGLEFIPEYFEKDLSKGFSELTEKGRKMVEEEIKEPSRYCLELGGVGGESHDAEGNGIEQEKLESVV